MQQTDRSDARIIIVDDNPANVELLEHILEHAGYTHIRSTTDPRAVFDMCAGEPPDLLLLDLMMPHLDGMQVTERLREEFEELAHVPVAILTSDGSREAKKRALSSGAKDFMTKPLSPSEVRLRVANLLETRFLQLELQRQNERLEERVRERTGELEEARIEILERLALAAEYRDDETGEHTRRVGRQSATLAAALELPAPEIELIRRAAPLHDVGKIGIPDNILLKPGKLTPAEFERIKSHTTIGAQILSGSRFPLLQMAEAIALSHHENWNGTGYPAGLRGTEIPLPARIVSVVDVFDSLTHERVYKEAWPEERALDLIEQEIEGKFDPTVARAYLRIRAPERIEVERTPTDVSASAPA
jgi:putative two-component system response regulator